MAKVRVYELAKDLQAESKQIIEVLSKWGIDVKNHMSTIEDDVVDKVRKQYQGKPERKADGPDQAKAQVKVEEKRTETENKTQAPQGEHRSERPQGDRPYSHRPDGNRPQGDRPDGNRPYGNRDGQRPQGDRPYNNNNRPQGDRPYNNNRPQGDRPYNNNRPQGDRPYNNNRPQGDRPYNNNRPQGDRPYNNNRPQGDRPYNNNRPQGDRPQGDRPYNNRPQGDRPYGNRPQGDRPQGDRPYNNRPQGDRPYGNRPQGDRPQGDRPYNNRPQGDRPYGNRPQGDRPQGDRPYGNRPQGDRPYGNRPQGDRPQGDRPYGNRPQGDRPYGNRPQGDRPGGYNQQGRDNRGGGFQNRSNNLEVPAPAQVETKQPNRAHQTRKPDNKKGPDKWSKSENEGFFNKNKQNNRHGKKGRHVSSEPRPEPIKSNKPIVIGDTISVQDFAHKMGKTASDVIKKLIALGVMATINQEIDSDTASILAAEFGFQIEIKPEVDIEELLMTEEPDKEEDLISRSPVVTVMGHVDHGKTSLLDAIRETNVIAREAGGITQHIGAYQVEHHGKKITFLDTPGHEAFTAMRARGAQVTDISILVVAADDGVMPQTIEAINHSKAANVPIIVAVNKIDKVGANPEKVKQELMGHGLVAEEWGGDTIFVEVSAKARQNIDSLLEMILLVAEVADYKANPNKLAKGSVVEAELDKGRGPVATILVQSGTLNIGDAIVAGTAYGKVRAMVDDTGRRVKKAGPAMPVEVLGLSEVPAAGDLFFAVDDDKFARQVVAKRLHKKREEEIKAKSKISLDDLFSQIKEGQVKDLNIIIKADVQGSIEALKQSLEKLSTDEVRVNPIHGGVGAITETDIMLASASNAIIIGFNVRPDANASKAAEKEDVDIRLYTVIYAAIEEVKTAMEGLLDPEFKEVVIGQVEVRQTFKVSKVGTIAGCYVTDGKITNNSEIRVIREGIVVHEGKIADLKRFKDDAKEVREGFECGITLEKFNDIREGDIIEAFIHEEVKRAL